MHVSGRNLILQNQVLLEGVNLFQYIYKHLEKDEYHAKKYINNYYVITGTYTRLTLIEHEE